jgi:hypothetical protein
MSGNQAVMLEVTRSGQKKTITNLFSQDRIQSSRKVHGGIERLERHTDARHLATFIALDDSDTANSNSIDQNRVVLQQGTVIDDTQERRRLGLIQRANGCNDTFDTLTARYWLAQQCARKDGVSGEVIKKRVTTAVVA